MNATKKEPNGVKGVFLLGVASTLFGGALWGFSGTSVQFLTTQAAAPPALVSLMRTFVGGIIFLVIILILNKEELRKIFSSTRSIAKMALFALSLYGNQICYAQTVQITNAGTATVLQMLSSALVMVYVCARNRRAPRVRELIGLVLALVSTVLIATQGDLTTLKMPLNGLIWGLLTGVSAALYIVVPKECGLFEEFGSVPVVGIGMLMGSIYALLGCLGFGVSLSAASTVIASFGLQEWLIFFFGLVLAGTMGGYGFYLHGVSIVGSVKGSLLGAIEPVSATIMASLWLGTIFTGFDVAGLVLMCIMLLFVSSDE